MTRPLAWLDSSGNQHPFTDLAKVPALATIVPFTPEAPVIDNSAAEAATTAEGIVIADLEAMVERLDEMEEYGEDEGYRALVVKTREARGPLVSALGAMRQYGDGTLTRKDT